MVVMGLVVVLVLVLVEVNDGAVIVMAVVREKHVLAIVLFPHNLGM